MNDPSTRIQTGIAMSDKPEAVLSTSMMTPETTLDPKTQPLMTKRESPSTPTPLYVNSQLATLDPDSLCVNSQIENIKTTLDPKTQPLMTERESPLTPTPLYVKN